MKITRVSLYRWGWFCSAPSKKLEKGKQNILRPDATIPWTRERECFGAMVHKELPEPPHNTVEGETFSCRAESLLVKIDDRYRRRAYLPFTVRSSMVLVECGGVPLPPLVKSGRLAPLGHA